MERIGRSVGDPRFSRRHGRSRGQGARDTTGTFTADARKKATRDGAPAIDLVDGEDLCDLLKRLEIGVSTQKVEHVFVEQDAFLQF
jgi:restriction system protein